MSRRFQVVLVSLLCCLLLFSLPASAHSGGTDSNGGHTNHSTGEYHYHHGYPAHQHPNGVCPYETTEASDSTLNKYVVAAFEQASAEEAAWRTENSALLEMGHEELVKEYLSMKQSFETVKAQRDALYEEMNSNPEEEEKSFREQAVEELTLDSLYKNALTSLDLANENIDELSIEVAELKGKNTFLEKKNEVLQSKISTYEDNYFSVGIAVGIVLFVVVVILIIKNARFKRQLASLREEQSISSKLDPAVEALIQELTTASEDDKRKFLEILRVVKGSEKRG